MAVKATYLYKLPQFVSWPAGAIPADRFTLCVVGPHRFGSLLDRAVAGQTVQGRPIEIRRYSGVDGNPGCQVIYVTLSGEAGADVVQAVRGTPVLTVTDEAEEHQGVVDLRVMDGHVRFAIDAKQATDNHLVLSSKLLGVAVRVRNSPG